MLQVDPRTATPVPAIVQAQATLSLTMLVSLWRFVWKERWTYSAGVDDDWGSAVADASATVAATRHRVFMMM